MVTNKEFLNLLRDTSPKFAAASAAFDINADDFGKMVVNYQPLYNAFIEGVQNDLAKTNVYSPRMKAEFTEFIGEMLPSGSTVRDLYIDYPQLYDYDPDGKGTLDRMKDLNTRQVFHTVNVQKTIGFTIQPKEVEYAFSREYGLEDYTARRFESAEARKNLFYRELITAELAQYKGYRAIHVDDPVTDEDFLRVMKEIETAIVNMKEGVPYYNALGRTSQPFDDDIYLFVRTDIYTAFNFATATKVWNLEQAQIRAHIKPMLNLGDSSTVAVLVEKEFFKNYPTMDEVWENKNAKGAFRNYFHHLQGIWSVNAAANAVIFTTAAVKTVSINGVKDGKDVEQLNIVGDTTILPYLYSTSEYKFKGYSYTAGGSVELNAGEVVTLNDGTSGLYAIYE